MPEAFRAALFFDLPKREMRSWNRYLTSCALIAGDGFFLCPQGLRRVPRKVPARSSGLSVALPARVLQDGVAMLGMSGYGKLNGKMRQGGSVVLRIEEADLDNVLLAHKDAIGSLSVGHGVADAVAGIFYIATALSAGFPLIPLVVLAIMGLLFACYGC